jgi:glyoxylase-like metal-dependent hydrolase (beta-lactamase superfamily II)
MRFDTLCAHNPGPYTGAGTNTYFLHGSVPTLIDAGSGAPRHLDEVAAATEAAGGHAAGLAQVLGTHAHDDHIGGAPSVARRWPTARFAKYPWPGRDGAHGVAWAALADDERIEAGDVTLWAIHTPGHSPDHLCFFEPRSSALFAGDLVVDRGTVMIPASDGGNLSAYLASLRRIRELEPRRIYPGHGAPVERPAALLRAYIAHRLAREREIAAALRDRPLSIPAIVEVVYPALPAEVRAAAAESVLAHLVKLRDDARVVEEREGGADPVWRLVGAA